MLTSLYVKIAEKFQKEPHVDNACECNLLEEPRFKCKPKYPFNMIQNSKIIVKFDQFSLNYLHEISHNHPCNAFFMSYYLFRFYSSFKSFFTILNCRNYLLKCIMLGVSLWHHLQ